LIRLWISGDFSVQRAGQHGGLKKKGRPKAAHWDKIAPAILFFFLPKAYALSPYTVTVISTTTSVCSATLTVLSHTTLIGPAGMRTCDFAIL
jgi:hypothetical protein